VWLLTAVAVFFAAAIVPGVHIGSFGDALVAAVVIGALNAVLPPAVAALRLPFTLILGFVVILLLDALILLLASHIDSSSLQVASFGWALLAALVISALILMLEVILGANDDDTYSLRVINRVARRQGKRVSTDVPGMLFLEIDGLALPVLDSSGPPRGFLHRVWIRWTPACCLYGRCVISGPLSHPDRVMPRSVQRRILRPVAYWLPSSPPSLASLGWR